MWNLYGCENREHMENDSGEKEGLPVVVLYVAMPVGIAIFTSNIFRIINLMCQIF